MRPTSPVARAPPVRSAVRVSIPVALHARCASTASIASYAPKSNGRFVFFAVDSLLVSESVTKLNAWVRSSNSFLLAVITACFIASTFLRALSGVLRCTGEWGRLPMAPLTLCFSAFWF